MEDGDGGEREEEEGGEESYSEEEPGPAAVPGKLGEEKEDERTAEESRDVGYGVPGRDLLPPEDEGVGAHARRSTKAVVETNEQRQKQHRRAGQIVPSQVSSSHVPESFLTHDSSCSQRSGKGAACEVLQGFNNEHSQV